MSELNRRDFLKIGAGRLAGLAAGQFLPLDHPLQPGTVRADPATMELASGAFVFDQRVIGQVDAQGRVLQSTLCRTSERNGTQAWVSDASDSDEKHSSHYNEGAGHWERPVMVGRATRHPRIRGQM